MLNQEGSDVGDKKMSTMQVKDDPNEEDDNYNDDEKEQEGEEDEDYIDEEEMLDVAEKCFYRIA